MGRKRNRRGVAPYPQPFSLSLTPRTLFTDKSRRCWCFFTKVLVNSSSEVALACYRLQDSGEESFNKKDGVKRNAKNARGLTLTLASLPVFRRHRPISQVARVLFSLCSF